MFTLWLHIDIGTFLFGYSGMNFVNIYQTHAVRLSGIDTSWFKGSALLS